MLHNLLTNKTNISLACCFIQMYTYFLSGSAEFLLFAVMSVDRYLAICYPLRYTGIMHRRLCFQLMAGVWIGSFFTNLMPLILLSRLTFCRNLINHFFCDVAPLLQNSCTDTTVIQIILTASSSTLFISFIITFASYSNIILAILKIQSVKGRGRAFSTCSSHAIVVTLIYGSCIFMYAKPMQGKRAEFNKQVALVNTVVVPLINPFIYTLRNQNVRKILKECFNAYFKNW
ncbi:olfactory receptor 6M1-like [Pelobates fuscus]|uniref:olfactory receptor 6M1-like n=1 Tax=Pelobates fuscus TaxID=191477 RepID=UPI002FE4990F